MRKIFVYLLLVVCWITACGTTGVEPMANETGDDLAGGSETAVTDGRQAVFPNPIVVYQREGRFPGSPQQWTFYTTGRIVAADDTEWQLPAEVVKPLFDLVTAPDFQTLNERYAPEGECLDCLTHTLTVYSDEASKEITVVQATADWPAGLERVFTLLDGLVTGLE